MYVNERDQINYHGFLRALRKMNKVQQENVSIGICTVSGMNRFENGNRIAEKLMRDRLTARLGISGEKYEDYLQRKEYIRWQHRLRIVKAIEKRELHVAKEELDAYAKLRGLNVVNKQFVETMHFMILSLEDAPKDELLDCITKAVKWTVPNVENALNGTHLLSDQEINLIGEQMRLTPAPLAIADESAWRISEYENLITYIDNSHWEVLQKAKIYPKIVYYICKLMLEKENTEAEIRHGLDLCHTAIELLRDSSRLYYFVELTEIRKVLAERLLDLGVNPNEKQALEEMLETNESWEKVFKDLYAEYKVEPYMSDFCYLYYETECHDMAEVIEVRRNMFDLSRVRLSEGICDERTIIRFEREGRNPSVETIRALFEKLGLCAEYRRARVITNDVEALMLSNEVTYNMNNRQIKLWGNNIEKLKNSLDMSISHNRQEVIRQEAILKYRKKELDSEELYINIIKSLECTLPVNTIICNRIHITRSEVSCLYDLAFKIKGEVSQSCINYISARYGEFPESEELLLPQLCVYEFILDGFVSYLGNIGKYNESQEKSVKILKECLTHRRLEAIAIYLYNLLWNKQKLSEELDVNYTNNILTRCLITSIVNKSEYRIAFFQEKLKCNDV